PRLPIPLRLREQRVGRRDARERAPRVLVVERRLLVGARGPLRIPAVAALSPHARGEKLGAEQELMRRPVHPGLVSAGRDAVRPPVDPVTAARLELAAVPLAEPGAECAGCCQNDARRPALVVPPVYEVGQPP